MVAVRWYLRYGLSYRDVEELLAERGIDVDHVTIYRWVQRFTALLNDAARPCRHASGDRWFVDETYVKVAGRWVYLHRAIDQFGQVIDVLVSEKRDLAATRRFFTRALEHNPRPTEVTTDRVAARSPRRRRPGETCCAIASCRPDDQRAVPAAHTYAADVTEQRGGWRTFGEKTVYDNRWVRLGLVDVEAPNGERWEYHVVHLDRIAVALIVDDQDRVLMCWRYRFVTEQWGYELLGGMVDTGEDAADTAARETEEESGWRPLGEPEHLVSFEPLPGQVTAPVEVFLWREAERIGEPTDMEEVGRVEWVPLSRVPELARRGELLGSGTLVALLYYLASRGGAAAG